jgi:hypothetical protein
VPFLRRQIELHDIRSPNKIPSSQGGDRRRCSTENIQEKKYIVFIIFKIERNVIECK